MCNVYTGVDQRATMTEVCLVPAEFDDYQIGVDAAITFCLKELRVPPLSLSLSRFVSSVFYAKLYATVLGV